MESLRSMMERVVVTPREGGGVTLGLHGDFGAGSGDRLWTNESPSS
jgi:hypothetical protein